jgi:hypothetical protein
VEESPDFEKANESTVRLIRGAAMEKGVQIQNQTTGQNRSPRVTNDTDLQELKPKKLPTLKGGARAFKGSEQGPNDLGASAPRRSPAVFHAGGYDTNTLYYQTSGPKEVSQHSPTR